jgi:hypothetical protein
MPLLLSTYYLQFPTEFNTDPNSFNGTKYLQFKNQATSNQSILGPVFNLWYHRSVADSLPLTWRPSNWTTGSLKRSARVPGIHSSLPCRSLTRLTKRSTNRWFLASYHKKLLNRTLNSDGLARQTRGKVFQTQLFCKSNIENHDSAFSPPSECWK